MIALMPTEEDAKRLAVKGGEAAADLHVTLYFLGEMDQWDEDQRNDLRYCMSLVMQWLDCGPVTANVFGAAHWNGNGDTPAWVWSVGDAPGADAYPQESMTLSMARDVAICALEDMHRQPDLPAQHSPWVPHICAEYSDDLTVIKELEKRLGPVTFDRIRVSFGSEDQDYPLTGSMTAAGVPRRKLSDFEVASRADFAMIDKQWDDAVGAALTDYTRTEADQRAQLREQITKAVDTDNLDSLDSLHVDTDHMTSLLVDHMTRLAVTAGKEMQREAEHQGITVPDWDLNEELTASTAGDVIRSVARVTARSLGLGLVQSAGRRALTFVTSGRSGKQVASMVDRDLKDLSVRSPREFIGSAMSSAQNTGRMAVLRVAPAGVYMATEVLDKNTCGPCRTVDGTEFTSLSAAAEAYPSGAAGYANCAGGGRCRGTMIAVWGSAEVGSASSRRPRHNGPHGQALQDGRPDGSDQPEDSPEDLGEASRAGGLGRVQHLPTPPMRQPAMRGDHTHSDRNSGGEPPGRRDQRSAEGVGSSAGQSAPVCETHRGKGQADLDATIPGDPSSGDRPAVQRESFTDHEDSHRGAVGPRSEEVSMTTTTEELGGNPNPGTKKDKRLKENPKASAETTDGADVKADDSAAAPGLGEITLTEDGRILDADGNEVTTLAAADNTDGCPPNMMKDPATGECGPMKASGQTAPWEGVLAVEDQVTGDGREFAGGALSWPDTIEPGEVLLRWNKEDSHGGEPHTTAVTVGRIDSIWRDGTKIMGKGVFDLGSPDGEEAHRRVQEKFLRGVSIDADSIGNADVEFVWPENAGADEEADPLTLLLMAPEKVIYHGGRIRAATLCDIPAFAEAYIALTDESGAVVAGGAPSLEEYTEVQKSISAERAKSLSRPDRLRVALTAHGGKEWRPPAEWFENPQLSQPTTIHVTEDGRVFGHAAQWGACHIGFMDVCTQPPREDDFPYFATGELITEGGKVVTVGQITVTTNHADLYVAAGPAKEHYENTGNAIADVAVGADRTGIWVAGAIRPNADPLLVHELRASGEVSGDWRRIGGQHRLVGLLGVNVGGFVVPRMKARVAGGQVQALIASGRLTTAHVHPAAPEPVDRKAAYKIVMDDLAAQMTEGSE
jgi:hypothetical protein